MPIRFLCPNCGQVLSIGRRKAGIEVTCPKCRQSVTVPAPGQASSQAEVFENLDFDEFLLSPGGPLSDEEGDETAPPPPPSRPRAPLGRLIVAGSAHELPKRRLARPSDTGGGGVVPAK